ncbi:hypothetical protein HPB50_010979 [Hyalomma asiaticum]|uniref:Uncharacterized protein n=1 Tax=Hyalomma asiaticum TaxID=266040 RepID=A0ACB7RN14_HYAAI|nr:hypothetical protein HPB50_010979 [Hyalomma asiaticum]
MTDKDVNTVCSALSTLPFQELLLLYCETVPHPVIVGVTPVELIVALRDWLYRKYILEQRLHCIAILYSRIAIAGSLKPWMLYRLKAPIEDSDATTLLNVIVNKLKHGTLSLANGYHSTLASVCCSVLLSDGPLSIVEHRLVCFNVWPMEPFLAVHAPGMIAHSEKFHAALVSALGDPENCLHGYYGDLNGCISEILRTSKTR